jgi:hypothetical protein
MARKIKNTKNEAPRLWHLVLEMGPVPGVLEDRREFETKEQIEHQLKTNPLATYGASSWRIEYMA